MNDDTGWLAGNSHRCDRRDERRGGGQREHAEIER